MARYSLTKKLELCGAENKRFSTDACKHYYEICNLCGEQTFCVMHGCRECGLKAHENNGSLSVLPDEERLALMIVEEQRANLEPQKRLGNAKHKKPADYYRTLYLKDILEANLRNDYQV